MNLDQRFAAWSKGDIDDAEILKSIDSSRASIEKHQHGFASVVDSLSDTEGEHVSPLVSYCEELMDRLPALLEEARASVVSGERGATLSLADSVSRSSFQLGAALHEFRNQVLLVRGPTRIPSLNLLYSLGGEWSKDPGPEKFDRFMQALSGEIAMARNGIHQLEAELMDAAGKDALKRSFMELVEQLQGLQKELQSRAEKGLDLTGYLLQLNMTYTDIHDLRPKVALELQDHGETEYGEINRLLSLLDAVAEGERGEELLWEALDGFDEFIESLDRTVSAAGGGAAGDQQLEVLSDALTCYGEGVALATDFQERRDPDLLRQARRKFVEFGALLDGVHKSRKVDLFDDGSRLAALNEFVPEKLVPLYRAVDELLIERIDEQAYLQVVKSFEQHLRGQLKSAKTEEVSGPIKSMLVGLQSLQRFPARREEEELRQGVLALKHGAEALRQVLA